jgi:hypothetical protein
MQQFTQANVDVQNKRLPLPTYQKTILAGWIDAGLETNSQLWLKSVLVQCYCGATGLTHQKSLLIFLFINYTDYFFLNCSCK